MNDCPEAVLSKLGVSYVEEVTDGLLLATGLGKATEGLTLEAEAPEAVEGQWRILNFYRVDLT